MPHRRLIADWDSAYANVPNIPEGASFPPRWAAQAQAFRASLDDRLTSGISYGPHERQAFDLARPVGEPKGLVIFIHGGYWMRFHRTDWTHLAAGPLAHGHAVAFPSYRLCPEVRITDITADARSAIAAAAATVDGPIVLAGHSAGGHLATRAVCSDTDVPSEILKRIRHVVSISGVHDLRPLLRTQLNETFRLDAAEAAAESPALREPLPDLTVTCWAGAGERGEFLRQNALLANIWTGLGASTSVVEEADRHHFDVIDGVADPDHALCRLMVGG